MNPQRARPDSPITHPLADPIMSETTARHRRPVGRFGPLEEATVWDLALDILAPRRASARRRR